MTRIVCLSDTHNQLDKVSVPDGDVLIHAGDATNLGRLEELSSFHAQMASLPHKHKILIAGNHDWLYATQSSLARSLVRAGVTYLQDSGVVLDPDGHLYPWDPEKKMGGLKFWGAPWQPEFCNWAFNLSRMDGSLAEKWALIPEDTDVLVTHGPPKGILDLVYDRRVGCADLLDRVLKVKPKLHVFGHIHYSRGEQFFEGTHFVNAAICDETYSPVNAPVIVDL